MKQLVCCLFLILISVYSVQAQEQADQEIFDEFMNYATSENLAEKATGERIAAIARFFLETPYKGCTLEAEGPERLQVNLRELDCTTLVENVLALNLTFEAQTKDFDTFKNKLTLIRYRNGLIDGYPSRLHYTTDWLLNNKEKGLLKIVCLGRKAESFPINVNFMSTHPEAYPALQNAPEYVKAMAAHEDRINRQSLKYLPKEKVESGQKYIRTGDIIAVTTNLKGLDFSHLGIAIVGKDKQIYLLHASSSGKKVIISQTNLKEYLSDIKKHTGIVVARPL